MTPTPTERKIQKSFTTNLAFADLPAELRLMIYSYLLRPRGRLVIDDSFVPDWNSRHDRSSKTEYLFPQQSPLIRSPSAYATYNRCLIAERHRYGEEMEICTKVMLLNRQIGDEALQCLYGQHLEFACSPEGLGAFLKDRPATVLGWITNITLEVPSESGRIKFKSVCSFIAKELRLKRLVVRINTFWWEHQPFETIQRLQGRWNGEGAVADLLKLNWVHNLLQIKNLDSLEIEFDERYAAKKLTCGVELTRLLGATMLKDRANNTAQESARQGQTHDAGDIMARKYRCLASMQ
ncbi:MAG: hypothetical protein Q9207_004397 [Kuettlingeria erythrocarpa]